MTDYRPFLWYSLIAAIFIPLGYSIGYFTNFASPFIVGAGYFMLVGAAAFLMGLISLGNLDNKKKAET